MMSKSLWTICMFECSISIKGIADSASMRLTKQEKLLHSNSHDL